MPSSYITGTTAANIDISKKLGDALPIYMAFVIGLTMFLLLIVFRSILVPIKAAIAILLSIGAALGVVVAIFQWGWLDSVIGVNTHGADRELRPAHDVRHPLRALHGLRGLHPLAHP